MGQEKLRDGAPGLRPQLRHKILLNPALPSVPLGLQLSSINGTPRFSGAKRRQAKVSLACSPCRKAKKKCDGCCPCSACLSLERSGACKFDHDSDGRRKYAVKKTLENVRQEKKLLQDIFNYLRDTDIRSAAVLLTKIRQGLSPDELTKCIAQKEAVSTGLGVFCQTEVITAPISLQSPTSHEAVTASVGSRRDWELPPPIGNTSMENVRDNTRAVPLTWEAAISERRVSILRAAANGDEALMVSLLRDHETPLTFTNAYSQTPLSLAAENGHEGVVRLLLKRNDIGINCYDLDGQTALAWAAFHGHSAVIQLLLELDDLDANSKDIDGNTPLSWAATNGYDRVVALLLERYDVAIRPVNNCGRTPLSLALGNGHERIVRRLSWWDDGPHLGRFEH